MSPGPGVVFDHSICTFLLLSPKSENCLVVGVSGAASSGGAALTVRISFVSAPSIANLVSTASRNCASAPASDTSIRSWLRSPPRMNILINSVDVGLGSGGWLLVPSRYGNSPNIRNSLACRTWDLTSPSLDGLYGLHHSSG